jgi:selenocysteine lyase/cysteine desulfurase
VAAVREGGIRFSPHMYNTVDEIDAVVDALEGPGA